MSTTIPQEITVRKETLLESPIDKTNQPFDTSVSLLSPVQVLSLQNRMESLEQQIKNAVSTLAQRQNYVNALAIDLEHIILQLINKLDKKEGTS